MAEHLLRTCNFHYTKDTYFVREKSRNLAIGTDCFNCYFGYLNKLDVVTKFYSQKA